MSRSATRWRGSDAKTAAQTISLCRERQAIDLRVRLGSHTGREICDQGSNTPNRIGADGERELRVGHGELWHGRWVSYDLRRGDASETNLKVGKNEPIALTNLQ